MMSADHFDGVEQFEADLWRISDDLRANSGLASNEYFLPVMGLVWTLSGIPAEERVERRRHLTQAMNAGAMSIGLSIMCGLAVFIVLLLLVSRR